MDFDLNYVYLMDVTHTSSLERNSDRKCGRGKEMETREDGLRTLNVTQLCVKTDELILSLFSFFFLIFFFSHFLSFFFLSQYFCVG